MLPEGYQRLFERAVEVLSADDRIRAQWIGGSLATGLADRASDLDLLVAAADRDHETLAASWRGWLAAISPTVLARPLAFLPGSFYAVTPAFERVDVVVERASAIAATPFRSRLVVFDRDDLDARLPAVDDGGPTPARVAELVEEFFFHSGKVEVLVWRRDWLLGAEHARWLRSVVHRLYVEANGPGPRSGLKHMAASLTLEQRNVIAALPTDITCVRELVTAHRAAAHAFLPCARRLASEVGAPWPHDLEQAAATHVEAVLGIPHAYAC